MTRCILSMRGYLQLLEGDFLKLFCMIIKFRGKTPETGFCIEMGMSAIHKTIYIQAYLKLSTYRSF